MLNAPSVYPRLRNVRCYVLGRLDSRSGMAKLNAAALADLDVHSPKRLNNPGASVHLVPTAAGPFIAGTGTDMARAGGIPWNNPGNIIASDNTRANITLPITPPPQTTDWLVATNLGFALPAGSIVTGIAVHAEGYRSGFLGIVPIRVSLLRAGAISGGMKFLPTLPFGVANEATVSVGGNGELWSNWWLDTDVNDPGFGFAIYADKGGPTAAVGLYIDSMSMTVYYSAAGQAWTRVVGAGNSLYSGQTVFTLRDTGYSGDPLSYVPWRPENTPEAWLYVADSKRMRKIRTDGTNYAVGVAPPNTPAEITFGPPLYAVLELFDAAPAPPLWVNGGTAGAVGYANFRVNTTITALIYDAGTTGWASIQPAILGTEMRPGALIVVNTGGGTAETIKVQSVERRATATTIGSIVYDIGTVGLCTIQPTMLCGASGTTPAYLTGLMPGTLVNLGGTEIVRVISQTNNADGSASIRTSTTINHAAAESFTALPTFRAYCANNHAGGETLTVHYLDSAIGVGIGTIDRLIAYDLSQAAGRPLRNEDEIRISLLMDDPARLVEGRVSFDVDATINDHLHNAYYRTFRASDLQAAATGTLDTLTAMQTAMQNAQIEEAGTPVAEPTYPPAGYYVPGWEPPLTAGTPTPVQSSTQSVTGTAQWFELIFKVKDLQRIGADSSRNLSNVASIRISFNVTAVVNVGLSSLSIQGTYGPDVGSLGYNYFYRYRGRSSVTGAKSGWSPATRYGLRPHCQRVLVTMAQHADPQVDRIDVARYGGVLTRWMYVGTCPNSAAPAFADGLQDIDLNKPADLDVFQPFPTLDIPCQGTCNVTGTKVVRVTGDWFNTTWAPGSTMRIDGIDCVLYASPTSSTELEIVSGMGTLTAATFELPGATLLAQPLPSIWGPFNGAMLGCGDPHQPGVLFWTRGNDPDACSESGYLEVTSPSEPLIAGFMYNGLCYVYSSERLFAIYPSSVTSYMVAGTTTLATAPSTSASAGLSFITSEITGNKGLFDRNCLAVGKVVYSLSKDGIEQSAGGASSSITAEDLYLLFPHDGQPGQIVTLGSATFLPPAMTYQRLHYYDAHLYFDYQDATTRWHTLVYNELTRVWSQDVYNTDIECHYGEEGDGVHSLLLGGNDGFVRLATSDTDDGAYFTTEVRMPLVSDLNGYLHAQDGYLGVMADGNLNLIVHVDGVDHAHTVVAVAGGPYQKTDVMLTALKGLAWEFALTSSKPFRLFQRDTFFHLKPWGDTGAYREFYPFRELRRTAP